MKTLTATFILAALGWVGTAHAKEPGAAADLVPSSSHGPQVPDVHWPFEEVSANWDKDRLYRGYNVATQLCLSCHSFKYISHRNMMGAGFSEAEVMKLAEDMGVDMNDKLISPLDEETAKATYGKVPPDLSVMNKARPGGASYVYALLTGYHEAPEGFDLPAGTYYNTYFPGHAIAMPAPIVGPDMVEYHDDTAATVDQMARDVSYFMQWTAEPELPTRKHLGIYVLLYLIIFTVLAYWLKREIWRDVKKH